MKDIHITDTSGIWEPEKVRAETMPGFTECEVLHSEGYALLVKAKRKGRWWMLKGLKEEFRCQPLYEELFQKEVAVHNMLQHPSIVTLFDVEEVMPYGKCMVMEYVDGITLDDFLRTKPNRSTRHHIAESLLEVIEYIHSKQVVHRDLKPQNILITHNGKNLKLLDFGLADSDAYYLLKQPAGTLPYTSPEQCESRIADVRNDIYSLGIIFKEMHLGWRYGLVIRKCVLPADKRIQNIAAFKKTIRSANVMMWATIVLLCFAITSAAGTIVLQDHQTDKEAITELRDSLNASAEREKQLIEKHQQLLKEEQELKQLEQLRTIHEQTKADFIAEQEKIITNEYSAFKNPSHAIWHGKNISEANVKIHQDIQHRVTSHNDFNSEEKAAILIHLNYFCDEQFQPIFNKWITITYNNK